VRKRQQDGSGYVSRSAYKLEELVAKHRILARGSVVVDLGAAPGGWCQAVRRAQPGVCLFAVDRLPLQVDVPGTTFLQGDFTEPAIQQQLAAHLQGEHAEPRCVDVVLSDMMANTSGNAVRDTQASLDLCEAAYGLCARMLRPADASGGRPSAFVCKYYMSPEADEFRREVLERHFAKVRSEKLDASRARSREQYWVCLGFRED